MKISLLIFTLIFTLNGLKAQVTSSAAEHVMSTDSTLTDSLLLPTEQLDSLLSTIFTEYNETLSSFNDSLAGTWEDDKDNWERAFNVPPSLGITIIHSFYWRSSHFFAEYVYFFEVEHTVELEKAFFSEGDLVKINPAEYKDIRFFLEKPKWFVPEEYENYIIWKSKIYDTYYLFIDKKKRSIFFTEFRV